MKDEWTKGVQWGAMVWLVWLSASLVFHSTLETAKYGAFLPHLLPTIAWSAALALTWTRWSRSGVALAIAVQIISGAFLADIPVNYQYCKIDDGPVCSYLDLQPLLSAFMPQILPAIPLLFLVPDRPRLTMALALVGRWRDAGRSLAGWRWVLVAAGVALLARSGLEGLDWWNFNEDGVPYFRAGAIGVAFAPQVVLFALAELPRLRWPARSTVG